MPINSGRCLCGVCTHTLLADSTEGPWDVQRPNSWGWPGHDIQKKCRTRVSTSAWNDPSDTLQRKLEGPYIADDYRISTDI